MTKPLLHRLWDLDARHSKSLKDLAAAISDAGPGATPCVQAPERWQLPPSPPAGKPAARKRWTMTVLGSIVACHSCPVLDHCRAAARTAEETGAVRDLLDVVMAGRFLGGSLKDGDLGVSLDLASKENQLRLIAWGLTPDEARAALPGRVKRLKSTKKRKDRAA